MPHLSCSAQIQDIHELLETEQEQLPTAVSPVGYLEYSLWIFFSLFFPLTWMQDILPSRQIWREWRNTPGLFLVSSLFAKFSEYFHSYFFKSFSNLINFEVTCLQWNQHQNSHLPQKFRSSHWHSPWEYSLILAGICCVLPSLLLYQCLQRGVCGTRLCQRNFWENSLRAAKMSPTSLE